MKTPVFRAAGKPACLVVIKSPNRKGGITPFRKSGMAALLLSVSALGGCAHNFIPPQINYDDAQPAKLVTDPPPPVDIVELPKPLPLPGQLKPLTHAKSAPEPASPTVRVNEANAAARVQPVIAGFVNAVQVYPYSSGALYQVYTSPGEITDIALQDGEQLAGTGPVAAGDTVRWIIGDPTWPTLRRRYHLSAPGKRRQWTEGRKRLRFLSEGGTSRYPTQLIEKPNRWSAEPKSQQRASVNGFWAAFNSLRHI